MQWGYVSGFHKGDLTPGIDMLTVRGQTEKSQPEQRKTGRLSHSSAPQELGERLALGTGPSPKKK